eukprot:TRINITY_DN19388_c0_g1_i11.p1 TRINITY_DN19388_c0_g1~~TRINITY_DN19388_c0_g1_i11.p1  ORF type:complete len:189 (-),score=30.43 TRINITY_DN19388_c0_g1_i11:49-615(-)
MALLKAMPRLPIGHSRGFDAAAFGDCLMLEELLTTMHGLLLDGEPELVVELIELLQVTATDAEVAGLDRAVWSRVKKDILSKAEESFGESPAVQLKAKLNMRSPEQPRNPFGHELFEYTQNARLRAMPTPQPHESNETERPSRSPSAPRQGVMKRSEWVGRHRTSRTAGSAAELQLVYMRLDMLISSL